mgnify:FL=1
MNEKIIKFFKYISRGTGHLFINFSITLLFFAFFANLGIQQKDTLKQDLENFVLEKSNITQEQINQIKIICQANPNQEGCEVIEADPYEEIDQMFNLVKNYLIGKIFIIILLFILGFLLIFLGTSNLITTLFKISLSLTIQSFFAAFYYKFLPNIVKALLNINYFSNTIKEFSQDIVNEVLDVISNWLATPLTKTFKLALIIGVIFLVTTIILWIIKKKRFKRQK